MTNLDLQSNTTKVSQHRGYRITSRDLDILVAIYRFRFLTRHLVEWAFFSGAAGALDPRPSLAARRLKALHQAGYVQRLILPVLPGAGRAPLVYALSSRGADAVASQLGVDRADIDWLPQHNRATAFFMEHTLAIARLWGSLVAALRGSAITLTDWTGEAELRRRDVRVYDYDADRRLPLRPDGYFELHHPDCVYALFVEIDMGTETNDRVARKIRAYESYRRRGFEADYGWQVFDVLVITSGARRMENLIRITRRANDGRFGLFTTLDALHPATVLPGWQDCHSQTIDLGV